MLLNRMGLKLDRSSHVINRYRPIKIDNFGWFIKSWSYQYTNTFMSHVPSLRACMVSSQNQRLKSAFLLLCKKMLASPSDFNVCLRVLGKPGFLFWFLIHLAGCKLRSMLYRTELVGKISFLFHNLLNHFVNRIFQRKVRLFEILTCD